MQAAFLLPIINKLIGDLKDLVVTQYHCEPHAVIVSPTRELTIQIQREARKFSHGSFVKTVVAYGATSARRPVQDEMVSILLH
jgi:superfamily II DNA/RNA helicase